MPIHFVLSALSLKFVHFLIFLKMADTFYSHCLFILMKETETYSIIICSLTCYNLNCIHVLRNHTVIDFDSMPEIIPDTFVDPDHGIDWADISITM